MILKILLFGIKLYLQNVYDWYKVLYYFYSPM